MRKIFSLLTFLSVLFFAVQNLNAQVSGTVFRDIPVNGTSLNTYGVKDANELGVEGVTITVYPGGVTTTTAADGTYSVAASGAVRVEFSGWPSYLKPSPDDTGSKTSVQFVTAPLGNVDFGLHNPSDYTDSADPLVVAPVYANGKGNTGTTSDVETLVYWNYSESTDDDLSKNYSTASQTGSLWGIAYSKSEDKIFASAVLRRHMGLGPQGLGGIYLVSGAKAGTPTFSNWLDVTTLGINLGVVDRTSDVCHQLSDDVNVASHDPDGYLKAGRVGIGDIDLSQDEKTLYVMDLYNKQLLAIDVATKALLQTIVIPNPGCSDGDYRPWAINTKNGLYIGVVCSAETSQDRNDLVAHVMKYNGATFTSILSFDLDYTRTHTIWGNNLAPWQPWTTDLTWHGESHPEPILSDIEFDEKGAMILAFVDRYGLITGNNNYPPDCNSTNLIEGHAGGEILRACKNGVSWNLENNGSCGGVTTLGAGTGEGPGGGEFYLGDNAGPSDNGLGIDHQETGSGSLLQLIGSGQIMTTVFDPKTYDSGGVKALSNTTGQSESQKQVYPSEESNGNANDIPPHMGKAVGIGDIEFISAPAPIEIGNLVWDDTDGDGVQDPGELGISGVTIELKQGGLTIATATTDANGNYIFSNDPNGTTTASHIYNLTQLEPNMDYTLTVPTSNGGNSLTTKNSGEGSNPDLNDSDADTGTGEIQVLASDIPVTGANNHSYDIGYAPQSTGLGIECWAISDENESDKQLGLSGDAQTDNLFKLDKVTGTWSLIGSTTVANEETVAYDPFNNELYSVNGDQMGRLDQTTGAFTAVSSNYGDVRLPDGSTHDIHDVDGLCFDPFGKVIWATERISGYKANDLLFKIDASTHEIILNAFGPNVDAVPVHEAFDPILNKNVYDIDDIAVDPETGDLYAIQNEGGAGGVLTIINKTNGNVVINKGTFDEPGSSSSPVDDIEGLTFYNSGQLLASTGDNGPDSQDKNKLFLIDKNSAEATPQSPIDPSGERFDFEALTCLTDEPNIMRGSLFLDDDCNGVFDGSDVVLDGYQINIYRDVANNDVYDAGTDIFLTSTTTDASGAFVFEFKVASNSDFVITVDDPSSIPGYDHFSTTDVHEASFISGGNTDSGNDFGVCVANNSCNLSSAGKTNETCNNNSTGSDATDDYISFELNPVGSNIGATYNVSVDNGGTITPTTGTYGSATSFSLQSGSADGATTYTITITDVDDANCTITTTVQQNSCSAACSLTSAGKTNETCNNAGTSGDPSDDYISFDLSPGGVNTSTGYSVTVDNGGTITPTSGTYGTTSTYQLQGGSADGATTYTITITDNADPNCKITTTVLQNSCSTCTTSATITRDCNDNGTLPNEDDDYFNLTVTGTVTDGTGNYIVKIGAYTSASTASGSSVTITGDGQGGNPMLAADGATTYTVRIEDANDSSCFTEYTVGPVDECSECPAPDCLNVQVKKNN